MSELSELMGEQYFTADELNTKLERGVNYMQTQCREGKIRGKKVGNTWHISKADFQKWMRGE